MSSKLSKLLGSSKLATVPKPVKKYSVTDTKYYPTHQTIQTTAASLHRHDFGLKSALPSKIKSRYIIMDEIDTMERLTSFEPVSAMYWTKIKFQEMGVPVQRDSQHKNALFIESTINKKRDDIGGVDKASLESFGVEQGHDTDAASFIDLLLSDGKNRQDRSHQHAKFPTISDVLGIDPSTSPKVIKSIKNNLKSLRAEFQQYVLENHPEKLNPESFNKDTLSLELLNFIALKVKEGKLSRGASESTGSSKKSSAPATSTGSSALNEDKSFLQVASNPRQSTIEGTGGLSYLQRNRMRNTLHGFNTAEVVPGRLASENNAVAIGGFVTTLAYQYQGNSARAVPGKHFKEVLIPAAAHKATLTDSGAVRLEVLPVSKPSKGDDDDSSLLKGRRLDKNASPYMRSSDLQGLEVVNLLNSQF